MLHPALTRALATAHIEDLHRAAARWHTIRLARRVAHEPRVAATSIADTAIRLRAGRVDFVRPGRRHDTNRDYASSTMAMPILEWAASRDRSGIE